jgi:hypothetical protein
LSLTLTLTLTLPLTIVLSLFLPLSDGKDQVSADQGNDRTLLSPRWTRLEPEPLEGFWTDNDHAQYMAEVTLTPNSSP